MATSFLVSCSEEKYGDSSDYKFVLQDMYFMKDSEATEVYEEVVLDTIHVINNTNQDKEIRVSLLREVDPIQSKSIFEMDENSDILSFIIYDTSRKFSIPTRAADLANKPTIPTSEYSAYLSTTDQTVFMGDQFMRNIEVRAQTKQIVERKAILLKLPALFQLSLKEIWTDKTMTVLGHWTGVLVKDIEVEQREEDL